MKVLSVSHHTFHWASHLSLGRSIKHKLFKMFTEISHPRSVKTESSSAESGNFASTDLKSVLKVFTWGQNIWHHNSPGLISTWGQHDGIWSMHYSITKTLCELNHKLDVILEQNHRLAVVLKLTCRMVRTWRRCKLDLAGTDHTIRLFGIHHWSNQKIYYLCVNPY